MPAGCMTGAGKLMADETPKEHPAKHLTEHAWRAGQSGNPKGRPKGARNKLGEAFLQDMLADWEEHGPGTIQAVRLDRPDVYLKVVASVLPKDINVNMNPLEEATDEELIQRLRDLDHAIRPFIDAEGSGGDTGRDSKATAH